MYKNNTKIGKRRLQKNMYKNGRRKQVKEGCQKSMYDRRKQVKKKSYKNMYNNTKKKVKKKK